MECVPINIGCCSWLPCYSFLIMMKAQIQGDSLAEVFWQYSLNQCGPWPEAHVYHIPARRRLWRPQFAPTHPSTPTPTPTPAILRRRDLCTQTLSSGCWESQCCTMPMLVPRAAHTPANVPNAIDPCSQRWVPGPCYDLIGSVGSANIMV